MEYYSAGGGFPEMEGEPSSGQWQHEQEWHPHHTETALEEAMWADSPHPPYPERPNEPDCPYYMRTGLCRFGANCRFNHPPNRRQASMAVRTRDEFPERVGQPECQYYLKTGTCKFGATCKYHHPRDKAGLMGRTQLNILNLPLRPGEKDCAYYMRTGQCKFGSTCKFNHPNPEVSPVAAYQGVGSSSTPQAYPSGVPWQIPRPFLSVPRLQVPPSYAPVLLSPPQGVISIPGWNLYQGAMGAEGQQASYVMGPTASDPMAMATFPGYISGASESGFPERPGHPECQYYMKTGDCKYGMSCKFHHPRDRSVPSPTCILSPMGLPLRPGAPPCTYYLKSGYCKFGSVCKFDHPLITVPYSPLASPMSDIQQGSTYTAGGVSPVFVPTSTGLRRQPSSSSYPPHMTPSLTVPISSASFPPSSSS